MALDKSSIVSTFNYLKNKDIHIYLTAPSQQRLWQMAKFVVASEAEEASEWEIDLFGDHWRSTGQSSRQSANKIKKYTQ